MSLLTFVLVCVYMLNTVWPCSAVSYLGAFLPPGSRLFFVVSFFSFPEANTFVPQVFLTYSYIHSRPFW